MEWEKGGVEIVEAMGVGVESSRAESLWGREVVCGRGEVESGSEPPRG